MSRDMHMAGCSFSVKNIARDVDCQARLGGCKSGNIVVVFDTILKEDMMMDATRFKVGDLVMNCNVLEMVFWRVTDDLILQQIEVV